VHLVRKRLHCLRADKSPGADGLSPRLLKAISDEITVPVTMLFRQSGRRLCPIAVANSKRYTSFQEGCHKSAGELQTSQPDQPAIKGHGIYH